MKILKHIFIYTLWTIASIGVGIVYMRVLLGSNDITKEGIGFLAYMFYSWGLFHVGLLIGLIIALLFILLDVFYLKKKRKADLSLNGIRFLSLFTITVVVAIVHYVLEKVIDVV